MRMQASDDDLSSMDDNNQQTNPNIRKGLYKSQEEFSRSHPRAVLNEVQAIEIYRQKKSKVNGLGLEGSTTFLAKKYNISPKTIRDIWNRRTWIDQTRPLWTDDEKPLARKKKLVRPKARNQQQITSTDGQHRHSHIFTPCIRAQDMIPFAFAPLLQSMHAACAAYPAHRPEPIMSNTTFALLSALLQGPWPSPTAPRPQSPSGQSAGRPPPPPETAQAWSEQAPMTAERKAEAVEAAEAAETEQEVESESADDSSPADAGYGGGGEAVEAVWAYGSDDGGDAGGDGEYDGGILTGFDELDGPAAGAAPAPAEHEVGPECPVRADSDWPLW